MCGIFCLLFLLLSQRLINSAILQKYKSLHHACMWADESGQNMKVDSTCIPRTSWWTFHSEPATLCLSMLVLALAQQTKGYTKFILPPSLWPSSQWTDSRSSWCHGNFGPVKISVRRPIFFDKIGPADVNFYGKMVRVEKNGPSLSAWVCHVLRLP